MFRREFPLLALFGLILFQCAEPVNRDVPARWINTRSYLRSAFQLCLKKIALNEYLAREYPTSALLLHLLSQKRVFTNRSQSFQIRSECERHIPSLQ